MKSTKIAGWIVLVIAAVLWFTAIGGAVGSIGVFENQNDLQLIVLGGAVSVIAGLLFWLGD
ncbi:MAG: hypothetical protein ACHQ03_12155 [Candidatus Bathyarchaeia archaeon]